MSMKTKAAVLVSSIAILTFMVVGSLDGVRHDVGIIWRPSGEPARQEREAGGIMAVRSERYPGGHPIVFVGMSREVADFRWTVENDAERAIARAARAAYEWLTDEERA